MSETKQESPGSAGAEPAGTGSGAEAGRMRAPSRSVRPLRALWPYLDRYRALVIAALVALTVTAGLSLALPLAVRRVIDGFFVESAWMMDRYFGAAIAIAALLALGTAARFYLVTRLGERVIADIRRAIYDNIIGMSPAFFERTLSGEVLSRLTTDTTVVLSVIGSSVSVALRNILTCLGGLVLLFYTSPKLAGLVLVGVPVVVVPIMTLGRRLRVLSRESQDRIADSSAQASESLLAAQTVQANSHEAASRAAFGRLTEQAYDAARARIATRAVMTAIVIFLVFTSVVAVLWIGARDVRAGEMSGGELVQFVIYAVMVAGSVGALSEVWGELQRAASAHDHIRFGRPEATDAEVEAAARAAAADGFIRHLPQGYETYVGERGVMLSGGQRQRLALARAILRDAPILLLDEATSALDAESERDVQRAVEQLSKDRTTIVIAHRLATVKRADRICVFEDGRIVAEGSHESLVAEDGLYARLARLQFTDGTV